MKKMGAKELRALPREYFYILEHESLNKSIPKDTIFVVFAGLVIDLFALLFALYIGKITFALFLAAGFVVAELVAIAVLIFLSIDDRYKTRLNFYRTIELIGFTIVSYSMIPTVVSAFLKDYIPFIFILLALALFPLGIFFQWFIIFKIKEAIFEGKFLPGGEGFFSKEVRRKYMPYIYIFVGILESLRLGSYARARVRSLMWGNTAGNIVTPFLALVLVVSVSIIVAKLYIDLYLSYIFPDWLPAQKIMAQAQAQAPKQKSDTQQ